MTYYEVQSSHALRLMVSALSDAMNEKEGAWGRLNSLIDTSLENLRHRCAFKFCVWISGEDILQDLKLKIHRTLVTTRAIPNSEVRQETIEKIARSVKRMAHQLMIDQIRRLKGDTSPIKNVRLDDEGAESYQVFFAGDAKIDETVLLNELASHLTPLEREVLYLSLIEGLSFRSIGAQLGVGKNSVQRIRNGALATLVKASRERAKNWARAPENYMVVDLTSERQDGFNRGG